MKRVNIPLIGGLMVGVVTVSLLFAILLNPNYSKKETLKVEQSYAANNCNPQTAPQDAPFTVQNPTGYSFVIGCIFKNAVIYTDDNRFSIFEAPPAIDNMYYVRSGNIREKDDRNLIWSISLTKTAQIHILYRKIPGQTVPAWITSQYTKETNDDFTNLQQFLMRKNDQGLIGLYDLYKRKVTTPGQVQFGPASDATVNAYSMYLVSVNPLDVPSSTPTRTPFPGTGTAVPTPTVTPPPSGQGGLPSSILNLTNWKITLPTGSSGSPTEIRQPVLANFKSDPWFTVVNGGVRFRAPVNGVTTSGSSYPRSELREMTGNGLANAVWSSTSGTHTMTVETQPIALPATKPHIVLGQIHDAAGDVSVFRLEGTTLWITDGNITHGYSVDTNVTLGKRITIKFEVANGTIRYYYNGNLLPYELKKSFSGAYFKAGVYTQANCSNSSPCSASNYGETIMYNVQVSHQ